jgi:hypothetical protein
MDGVSLLQVDSVPNGMYSHCKKQHSAVMIIYIFATTTATLQAGPAAPHYNIVPICLERDLATRYPSMVEALPWPNNELATIQNW